MLRLLYPYIYKHMLLRFCPVLQGCSFVNGVCAHYIICCNELER